MRLTVKTPSLAWTVPWLLLTFLVLFPKGGVKFGGIPLTWGYVILGLTFVPLLFLRLTAFPLRATPSTLAAFLTFTPFWGIFFYSLYVNGQEGLSYTIAITTTFFFLPVLFLGVYPAFLRFIDRDRFCRYFCFCIFAAAVWGIFLFFYHPIMGSYIEIPYFTVNAGDFGQIENTKNISRGSYLKLISTYNNGNVYGVAMLVLMPLYLLLEPKRWRRNLLRVALVLTLSRTVWAGLVLQEVLSLVAKLPRMLARFPHLRPGKAKAQLIAVIATVGLVLCGLVFNDKSLAFIFESGLGGREGELSGFSNPTLLPTVPVTAFAELVYASALQIYGILGFLAVNLLFAGPILLIAWRPALIAAPSRRAAAKGLILYALVASIDGAALLIPVMAFYWFAYMVMLSGLPGEQAPAAESNPTFEPIPHTIPALPS